ncbi:hypothetical protein CISG_03708 [Coccidioides immitis RMSCC 3703]|uniref:Uncharacterized protein n=1 Tax=Coccidioides immitis RMSCC 3703 TaxID=454286 RepID=A0A0J8TIU5_COCIT|nr:hypothetical protein CISG_03708 [Coccidioides immitis RMSCC 3703]
MGTGTDSERERTPSLQPPRIINGGNRGKGGDRAGIVTTGRPSTSRRYGPAHCGASRDAAPGHTGLID